MIRRAYIRAKLLWFDYQVHLTCWLIDYAIRIGGLPFVHAYVATKAGYDLPEVDD